MDIIGLVIELFLMVIGLVIGLLSLYSMGVLLLITVPNILLYMLGEPTTPTSEPSGPRTSR